MSEPRHARSRPLAEFLLGARLTLAGGRSGLLRTLIAAFGVGLGVAALMLAASLPTIHSERQARSQGPRRRRRPRARPRCWRRLVATEFRGEEIRGRLLQAESEAAPVPPGIKRLPRPGELFVSPALAELLRTPDGRRLLAPRLPGRVVGEIGFEGLLGPGELGFYAGARDLKPGGPVQRIDRFGDPSAGQPFDPVLGLLVVIALVALLIPVGVVVGAAVRTGGEDRDRRLAALRLIGADARMARRIAAGEALVAAALGLVLGVAFFLAARGLLEQVHFQGLSVYARDVRPTPLLGALVVLGVPAAAVAVSLAALRRVVAEPLGVVRRAEATRPRRLWWRLVLPVAGLAILLPTTDQNELQVAVGDHRAAGRRRRAAAVGGRARRRAARGGRGGVAAGGPPPAARPRRRVARRQRDRGRRRRGDRAPDGLHRRAGGVPARDRRRPGSRTALHHARRAE